MDHQALMTAIMGVRSQIDFIWNFFVTAHIAIFALLFLYDHAVDGMNLLGRLLAIAGVAMFDWINGNAIRNAYFLLDALHDQYRASFGRVSGLTPSFIDRFLNASFVDRPDIVLVTHGLAFVVVSFAFLLPRFITRTRDTRQTN